MGGINLSQHTENGVLDLDQILESEEERYSDLNSLGENMEMAHEGLFMGMSGLATGGGLPVIGQGLGAAGLGLFGAEYYHNNHAVNAGTISGAIDDLQHQLELAEETGDWKNPALAAALETLERIYPEQNRFSGMNTTPDLIQLVKKAIEAETSNLNEAEVDSITEDKCFASGTLILLPDGTSAEIETLSSGDLVASFDEVEQSGRGELLAGRIVRVFENVTDCFIRLEYADGRDPLHVTPGHRVLDETGSFTKIGDLLRLGGGSANLIDANGDVIAVAGTWLHYSADTAHLFEQATNKAIVVNGNTAFREDVQIGWKTYNFEVEELHTYVAGYLRVHNDSGLLGALGNDIDAGLDKLFGVTDGDGSVGDELSDLVTSPVHALGQIVGGFIDAGKAIGQGFVEGAKKLAEGNIFGAVGEVAKGIGKALGEVASGIGEAIGSVGRAVGDAVKSVGKAIGDFARDVFGGNKDNDNDGNDRGKPVILDLDGDGVEINVNGNVSFDMDNDGFLEQGAWADADDGFLVIDLNADGTRGAGDGVINQTEELVLTEWLGWEGATDLQGFTRISDEIPRDQLLEMVNDYFGCVVESVHKYGGNVLKFLGDGVLAIFNHKTDSSSTCAAIHAAEHLRRQITELTLSRRSKGLPATGLYLGLHLGEVHYGNVGSEDRLDFTVTGPAVNEVFRIEGMCRSLERDVVISEEFAAAVGLESVKLSPLGKHSLKGVSAPQNLYSLDSFGNLLC